MTKQQRKEFFDGLKELVDSAFPKKCSTCERVYATRNDFFHHTESIKGNSGLKQGFIDDETVSVQLFRNCECGSTLMEQFCDRRDTSEAGIRRRQHFGRMLDKLVSLGIDRNEARTELLKLMHGQQSAVIKGLRLT